LGGIGATVCYLTAALSPLPILGLLACALTGFCVSMLWPGSLLVSTSRFPAGGVLVFALMAAGGDLGASVGPQLVGIITDTVAASAPLRELAASLALAPEQLGMKIGMLIGAIFPLVGCLIYLTILKGKKKYTKA
jgi:MFS family permease